MRTAPLLLLALWLHPRADVAFRPEEGLELAKSFETAFSIALDEVEMTVDGQEIDPSMMMQGLDIGSLTAEVTLNFQVNDTYRKVGEGRPLELLRSYESMDATYSTGLGTSGTKDGGKVVGQKILFRWNPETESYDRSSEEEIEDIERFAEDMDLRDLLPPTDDEQWTVPWRDHLALVLPGFDIAAGLEDLPSGDAPPEVMKALVGGLETLRDAVITCARDGEREVDGRRCAVIALESEVRGSIDLSSVLESSAQTMPAGSEVSRFDIEVDLDLAGELLWDIEAGHFHALELGGDLTLDLAAEMELPEEMGGSQISLSVLASGEIHRKARLE